LPAKPEPVAKEPEELPPGFDDLFKQIGQKPVDASSFWDSAVEKGTSFADPDKLTFEQASRMGISVDAPKGAEKPMPPRPVKPVKPEPVAKEPEELPPGFDDLFKQIGQKPADASSFWDSVVEKGTSFADPKTLTYEQASRMGISVDAPKPAPPPKPAEPVKPEPAAKEPDELPPGFDDLFKQIGQKPVDAKSFWDSVVEKGTSFVDPKTLTYEQASRMGISVDAPKSAERPATPKPAEPVKPEPAAEEPDELPPGFDDLFKQIGQKPADAKSFWDSVVEKGTNFADPDKLTFEQASRMGLAPDADKNKKK